ncbi:hypothetical protein Ciccas_014055, partial [Cichlidogyrus casuarinus]
MASECIDKTKYLLAEYKLEEAKNVLKFIYTGQIAPDNGHIRDMAKSVGCKHGDVEIVVKGGVLRAHAIVLKMKAKNIERLMRENKIESLKDCEVKDVESVLRFIYTGELNYENRRTQVQYVTRTLGIEGVEIILDQSLAPSMTSSMDEFEFVPHDDALFDSPTALRQRLLSLDDAREGFLLIRDWVEHNHDKYNENDIEKVIKLIEFERMTLEQIQEIDEEADSMLNMYPKYDEMLKEFLNPKNSPPLPLPQSARLTTLEAGSGPAVQSSAVSREFTIIACNSQCQTYDFGNVQWTERSIAPLPKQIY